MLSTKAKTVSQVCNFIISRGSCTLVTLLTVESPDNSNDADIQRHKMQDLIIFDQFTYYIFKIIGLINE
jgi:hypothetical protein